MKSATHVELVIELMSLRDELFAWVSILILQYNPLSDLYICDDSNENKMSVPEYEQNSSLPKLLMDSFTKRQRELYSDHSLSIHCLDWKVFFPPMLYSALIYILSFFFLFPL